jgi:hypothetical protein
LSKLKSAAQPGFDIAGEEAATAFLPKLVRNSKGQSFWELVSLKRRLCAVGARTRSENPQTKDNNRSLWQCIQVEGKEILYIDQQ